MRSALIALLAVAWSWPAGALDLTASDIHPAPYPSVQALTYMSTLLAEKSGGHLRLKVEHDSKQPERLAVEQVRNGTLAMTRVGIAVLNDSAPDTTAPALPFLFESTEQMRRALDGPIGDELLETLDAQGLIGLCFYDAGARSFFSSRKAIRSPADLRGMKVRVQPSEFWMNAIAAMGGTPQPHAYSALYDALRTGQVDAAENNPSSYATGRFHEVAPIYSLTKHSRAPGVVIFSKKVWERLAPKERATLRAGAKASASYMHRLWDEHERASRRTIEAAGVQVVTDIDRDAFVTALEPFYASRLTEPRIRDLVARIRAEAIP